MKPLNPSSPCHLATCKTANTGAADLHSCTGCGEGHTYPINAYKPYMGGWLQVTIFLCELCAEEMQRGNNPIYKPFRTKAA